MNALWIGRNALLAVSWSAMSTTRSHQTIEMDIDNFGRYRAMNGSNASYAPRDVTREFGEDYGSRIFAGNVIQRRLAPNVLDKLERTIHFGTKLDPEIADEVAAAMKDWAIENGCTLPPLVPAAHRSDRGEARFVPELRRRGGVIAEFTGESLVRANPMRVPSRPETSATPSRPADTPHGTPPVRPSSPSTGVRPPSAFRPSSSPGPANRSTRRRRCFDPSRRSTPMRCASSNRSVPPTVSIA